MAQNVYSLNVVGYYTVTVPAGQYKLIANQLVTTNYSVQSLFSLPDQTTLYKWVGTGYAVNNFDATFGWDDPTMTVGPGEATFVKNNGTAPINITFVGEVNQGTNTLSLPVGYKMGSLFTPQAGLLQTDFGYTPVDQEQVYQWKGTGYGISTFDATFGWDQEPNVAVGEGVFFKSPTAHTWTRSFKVQ